MEALYAFLRLSDDLADEPGESAAKRLRLQQWRVGLHEALDGNYSHPVHAALIHTIHRYRIPEELLIAALAGVESDLEPVRFAGFSDLYPYCFRVASVVGLACIRIWGYRAGMTLTDLKAAEAAAEAAGIAFQLTNILRDLREDVLRGRVYLPIDEVAGFGISPENWRQGPVDARDRQLLEFQIRRARNYYRQAEPLDKLLSTDGRAIFGVMTGNYKGLLDAIEKEPLAVFQRRVRVPRWRKGMVFLGGCAVRMGAL